MKPCPSIELQNEAIYEIGVRLGSQWVENGLLTPAEFEQLWQELIDSTNPKIGRLETPMNWINKPK